MDERPDPSDFREDQEEAAYLRWCRDNMQDPEDVRTAVAYERWFTDRFSDEDWYRPFSY
jgi:hypothetical protein